VHFSDVYPDCFVVNMEVDILYTRRYSWRIVQWSNHTTLWDGHASEDARRSTLYH